MKKVLDVLFLVMSWLYWTQTEGNSCINGTIVSIPAHMREVYLPVGEGFKLTCEFECLRPQHVAQLWKKGDKVSLINITSTLPNVVLVLNISSATMADTGYYYCMTQPPDTISHSVWINITSKSNGNLTSTLTTPSPLQCDSMQQHRRAAGLQGQIWFWVLLGKTAFLLLSLASLAVKYKRE